MCQAEERVATSATYCVYRRSPVWDHQWLDYKSCKSKLQWTDRREKNTSCGTREEADKGFFHPLIHIDPLWLRSSCIQQDGPGRPSRLTHQGRTCEGSGGTTCSARFRGIRSAGRWRQRKWPSSAASGTSSESLRSRRDDWIAWSSWLCAHQTSPFSRFQENRMNQYTSSPSGWVLLPVCSDSERLSVNSG